MIVITNFMGGRFGDFGVCDQVLFFFLAPRFKTRVLSKKKQPAGGVVAKFRAGFHVDLPIVLGPAAVFAAPRPLLRTMQRQEQLVQALSGVVVRARRSRPQRTCCYRCRAAHFLDSKSAVLENLEKNPVIWADHKLPSGGGGFKKGL